LQKKSTLIIIILYLYSCDFGLKKELNKASAESFINQGIVEFDKELLKQCNVEQVFFSNGNYLFVANSFNGDFNGYVYSSSQHIKPTNLKFESYYITNYDSTMKNWTKVYGKW